MSEYYLQHHGVLGMKWGIRRYQNKDGSYTREGLKRYKNSEDKYNDAKVEYRKANTTDNKYEKRVAKANLKKAKVNLSSHYDQVKRDVDADRGRLIYESGKTITDNKQLVKKLTIGTAAAYSTMLALDKAGYLSARSEVVASKALIGAAALTGIVAAKTGYENKKLRAYYGHSRIKEQ